MPRIRTIKPGFFGSLSIAALPIPTRLTFIGLWTYVDDAGRGVDDARLIKAAVWPLDDSYSTKKVGADLLELERAGRIRRYESCGRHYLEVVNFNEHQHVNRPQPSTLPSPGDFTEPSVNDHGEHPEPAVPEGKGKELEVEGKGTAVAPLLPDFEEFWSVYPRREAKGAAKKAWTAACRKSEPAEIIKGAQRYRDDPNREPGFTAHPASWLNAERWTDSPLPARGHSTASDRSQRNIDAVFAQMPGGTNGSTRSEASAHADALSLPPARDDHG